MLKGMLWLHVCGDRKSIVCESDCVARTPDVHLIDRVLRQKHLPFETACGGSSSSASGFP